MCSEGCHAARAFRPGALLATGMLTCFLWLASLPARAEETPAPAPTALTLTPADAADLALRNSLQLQRDAKALEQAEARLRQARALGKFTSQASASASLTMPTTPYVDSFNHQFRVSVSKPIYTGHRLELQSALARRGIEAAGARAAVTSSETAQAARTLCYNILRLDMLANVASQRATAVAEHLRITRAMEAEGTVPMFEVVQAETELAKAKGDIIAAQTATQVARATLANLLVLPQTCVLTVQEGVPLPEPQGSLAELIARGLGQRPELALVERQLKVAEANLELTRQSTNPRLDMVAQLNQQTQTSAAEPVNWVVGLALTKPLSDGGLRRAQVAEQAAVVADVKLQIEDLRQQIALEINEASLALHQAREQLTVAEAGEVNARERLRMAEVRYAAGLSIGVEVLDAQTAFAAAQTATVNARYDVQTSVVRLRKAVGDLDSQLAAPPE